MHMMPPLCIYIETSMSLSATVCGAAAMHTHNKDMLHILRLNHSFQALRHYGFV